MKYYSETTKKLYDSEKECHAAELAAAREAAEREAKLKEIENTYVNAKNALKRAEKALEEARNTYDQAYADYLKAGLTTKNFTNPDVKVKSWSGKVNSINDLNDALFNFFKN